MDNVSEKINVQEITKGCRELNVNELMQLLRVNISIFCSWGAHAFRVDKTKGTRMFRMTVSGHHHKGYVYIFVNGCDLFDVYLTSNRDNIKDKVEGLYFDQLVDWIDKKIEKIPDYVR
jgi:hypothetical protein